MKLENLTAFFLLCLFACLTVGCRNRLIYPRFMPNQSKCLSFEIKNKDGDAVFRFTNKELRELEKTWGGDPPTKFSRAQWVAYSNSMERVGSAECTFADGLVVHCDHIDIGKIGTKLLMMFSVPESEWSDDPCVVKAYLDTVVDDDRLIELEQLVGELK